jgi:hypothetical protein
MNAYLDAMRHQRAVEPKSVAASLVAADDSSVLRQAKALLRPCDLLLSLFECTSRYRPFTWLLRHTNGAAQFPGILPQFKRQGQRGLRERSLLEAGRCGSCHCLTPS